MPAGKREGSLPSRQGKTKPLPGVTQRERRVNKSPRQYPSRDTVRAQERALDRSLTVASMLPVGGAGVRAARTVAAVSRGAKAAKRMVRVSEPRSNVRVVAADRSFPTKSRISSQRIFERDPRGPMTQGQRLREEKKLADPRATVKVKKDGRIQVVYGRKARSEMSAAQEKLRYEKRAAAGITGDKAPRSPKQIRKDWKKRSAEVAKRSAKKYPKAK